MLTLPLTYPNPFTNEDETKNFYFNLTLAELNELNADMSGNNLIQRVKAMGERDPEMSETFRTLRDLVHVSYGQRVTGQNGEIEFIKTEIGKQGFLASEAYSAFMEQMSSDADFASKFVNGVMPKRLLEQMDTPDGNADGLTPRQRSEQRMQGRRGPGGKQRSPLGGSVSKAQLEFEEKQAERIQGAQVELQREDIVEESDRARRKRELQEQMDALDNTPSETEEEKSAREYQEFLAWKASQA
jgi:hypothetical protein